jgi:hypothetical protein
VVNRFPIRKEAAGETLYLRNGSLPQSPCMPHSAAAEAILLYFVLPLWLLAGLADYLCHRAARIELTSGYRESLLHLLMLAEVAIPLLAALFLEINALILALMIAGLVVHQLTALWDTKFASQKRQITPIEQHVHSFLELIPLTAVLIVIIFNWSQFVSLWGLGSEPARFDLVLKRDPLPWTYVAAFLFASASLEVLPFLEEFVRGWRARKRA